MINIIMSPFFGWIENKAKIKYYPLYLGFFLMISSWVFVLPQFVVHDPNHSAWQATMLKANDLTNTLEHFPANSWIGKKVFRLTVPVMIRIAHLSPLAVIIIQIFLGYLLYVYSYKLSFRILQDTVSATFLTAGLAFLYFGRAAYFDSNYTWFDSFAYFFILIALYNKPSSTNKCNLKI